jgi:hypothetical protein
MLIPILSTTGAADRDSPAAEWSIVELQGELETKDGSAAISNCDVGQVCFKKVRRQSGGGSSNMLVSHAASAPPGNPGPDHRSAYPRRES